MSESLKAKTWNLEDIDASEVFSEYLSRRRKQFDAYLHSLFPKPWSGISEAMTYSLFLPSKRIRPLLCLEVCKALVGADTQALPAAAALEMLHTYSLVHDDLPAMDNDDLRRGMPTNHIKFGEARAILAGDALLTKAFETLAVNEAPDSIKVRWVRELSRSSGMNGMVLGQDIDIFPIQDSRSPLERLEELHREKTGKLIAGSVVMGAMAAGVSEDLELKFRSFALDLGLAFQIQDDVLDVEGGADMGKPLKSDEKNEKVTYVSLLGLEGAKKESSKWLRQSLEALKALPFENRSRLEDFSNFVVNRKV